MFHFGDVKSTLAHEQVLVLRGVVPLCCQRDTLLPSHRGFSVSNPPIILICSSFTGVFLTEFANAFGESVCSVQRVGMGNARQEPVHGCAHEPVRSGTLVLSVRRPGIQRHGSQRRRVCGNAGDVRL